jgi:hypothetical protein
VVRRSGHQVSTAYTCHHRAGNSHAAEASLASVLKEGKKEVPATEAVAEVATISTISKCPWEARREDSEPQREQYKRTAWEKNQMAKTRTILAPI